MVAAWCNGAHELDGDFQESTLTLLCDAPDHYLKSRNRLPSSYGSLKYPPTNLDAILKEIEDGGHSWIVVHRRLRLFEKEERHSCLAPFDVSPL